MRSHNTRHFHIQGIRKDPLDRVIAHEGGTIYEHHIHGMVASMGFLKGVHDTKKMLSLFSHE